ncbi:MAG: hypothetical protein IJ874_09195 [Ruminococcus sp.]|nr:hypothetical protein [Ruminococcus sp.]
MSYADYGYYTDTYGGTKLSEAEFPVYAGKASERIDAVTFGRLESGIPDEYADKVQRCCCELAESIYGNSSSADSSDNGGNGMIASESNSKYSISYRSPADIASAQLHGSSAGLEDVYYSIIRLHLGRTDLLYRGADD